MMQHDSLMGLLIYANKTSDRQVEQTERKSQEIMVPAKIPCKTATSNPPFVFGIISGPSPETGTEYQ